MGLFWLLQELLQLLKGWNISTGLETIQTSFSTKADEADELAQPLFQLPNGKTTKLRTTFLSLSCS